MAKRVLYSRSVTGRVVSTRTLPSSYYGNPRYAVTLDSSAVEYATAPNASLAYAINNPEYRDTPHTFDVDGRGNLSGYCKPVRS